MPRRFLTPIELPGNAASALHAVPKQQLDTEIATRAASAHTHAGQAVRASDYGWATGAAAATNDTAIASAITAARGGNRRLYLGSGTYNISAPIDLKAFVGEGNCIEIFGDTRATTIINQTTATADVMQIGGYSAYVHDLTLRHSESAFTATPTTLGSGISMYKLAYSTVERVQLTCNGRGINIADADVFDPGGSSGTGNYFHTVNFTDCFILRYGVCGIDLDNATAVNTGSSFRNIWIQNQATNGTPIAPSSGQALSLFLCDEMSFTQLNIEDYLGNMPVLLNSCGSIMFESLHFERANLNGAAAQYIRVAGGSQLLIDGVTFAFSDVAVSGTTGTSHYFTAVTGGKMDLRGITIKNMDNTAARPLTLCDLDDADQGSSMDVAMPGGGDVDELTTLTNTAITNPGYIRVGDKCGPSAMPLILSPTLSGGPGSGTINTDASLAGGNRNYTANGNITIAVPTNPQGNGQVIQYAVLASGGARTITFNASFDRLTGIAAGPTSIASGEICRFSLRYQTLTSTWIVEAFGITQ